MVQDHCGDTARRPIRCEAKKSDFSYLATVVKADAGPLLSSIDTLEEVKSRS